MTPLPIQEYNHSSSPQFITVKSDGTCGGRGCLQAPMIDRVPNLEGNETSSALRRQMDEAVEELRQSRGENNPEFVFALTTIGNACAKNGDDIDAIRYFRKALPLSKHLEGTTHPKVADIMVAMALSMDKIGMSNESLEELTQALEIYGYARSITSNPAQKAVYWFQITNALNQIGNIYFHQRMMEEAGEKYSQALRASKEFLNEALPEDSCLSLHVADIINNVACVKAEQKDYEKSIHLFNQALELQIAGLGEEDPAVSITLNNIGTMNFKARKFEVALKSYKQVLKMRRFLFHRDHYTVAEVLVDIAMTYEKKRDYDRAARSLKEALRVTSITYGTKHEKIFDIYNKLGVLAKKAGHEEQSVKYFQAARSADIEESTIFGNGIFSH